VTVIHGDLPIGVREDGSLLRLPLSVALRHQLIVGPTGSGKTGALIGLALAAARACVRVVVVDPKGDLSGALRDVFLPVLAEQRLLELDPGEVVTMTAFKGDYATPLDPLVPIPDLDVGLQAHIVAKLLAAILRDASFGIRMEAVTCALVELGIRRRLTLRDLRRALMDDDVRYGHAARLDLANLSAYFAAGGAFDREPTSAKQAVRARLDALLRVPALVQCLCASSCVPPAALIESKFTICDFGDPPQGSLGTAGFLAGFVWQALVAAIFSRPTGVRGQATLLIVDEAPLVLEVGAEEAERVLSLARSRGIAIVLAAQFVGQIRAVSSVLLDSIRANVHRMACFRPSKDDLAEVSELLPVTGEAIDPSRPDRLLKPEEERRALEARLRKLPERHFLNVDFLRNSLEVLRTLDLPFDEAERRAAALPPQVRDAFARGRYGVRRQTPSDESNDPGGAPPSATLAPPALRRDTARRRPKLVLP